jgi:antitoxin MazE
LPLISNIACERELGISDVDTMKTAVQRWGNSLAIRIPRHLASESHVHRGSPVEVTIADGKLIIAPVSKRSYSLATLVKKISPRNRHGEVDPGRGAGHEGW